MTNEFVANSRQVPVLKDFLKKVDEFTEQENKNRSFGAVGGLNFVAGLDELAKRQDPKLANPEFVKARIQLLNDYLNKKLTKQQFEQGSDLIMQAVRENEKQTKTTA
jgi:ribosome biogenesis GTPase A